MIRSGQYLGLGKIMQCENVKKEITDSQKRDFAQTHKFYAKIFQKFTICKSMLKGGDLQILSNVGIHYVLYYRFID